MDPELDYIGGVDTRVLIDSIMRQTTVLIAQLSSAAGSRAPLAHIADEVFLNLSRELEQQGLSRKVVADMFGLALRGYQRRVQRLSESQTDRGTTLWQAVLDLIEGEGPVLRKRVFERFRYDDGNAVGAVLSDLCSSGLVYRTGNGEQTLYAVTQASERETLAQHGTMETTTALVWLELCRSPELATEELGHKLALEENQIRSALETLLADGRVRRDGARLVAEPLVVPVGSESGWEVAVFDHFQTVCVALATKLNQSAAGARADDTTGGKTVSFEIDDDHPERDAVLGLLAHVRMQVDELWNRVEAHNRAFPLDRRQTVRFYLGQVEMPREEES